LVIAVHNWRDVTVRCTVLVLTLCVPHSCAPHVA